LLKEVKMLASTLRLSRSVLPRANVAVRHLTAAANAAKTDNPPPPYVPPPLPPAPTIPSVPPPPGTELLSPVWSRLTSITIDRAEGSWIWGTDGKKYLDFVAGIATVSAGHCHPKIVKAAQEQLGKLVHGQLNVATHKPIAALVNRMKDFVKLSDSDRYFFSNSGAEAIEASIKLARHASGKTNVITFEGSFHGRTIGTMSLSNSKTIYRRGYQPLMPGVFVAPYPYTYRSQNRGDENACSAWCLKKLEEMLKMQTAPEDTAAILIEPVLGEGGYVPAPAAFLKGLRKLCDEHNILLIFDEIQSGIGRTGKWFAFQHYDVVPDILVFGKGIANGLPLSGLIAREELHKKWIVGSHGGTFGGNAVACAAALATIDYLKADYMLENAQRRSVQLVSALERLKVKYPFAIGEVRSKGLMVGLEFTDKVLKGTAQTIVQFALSHGMLLMTAGAFEVIRFMPPLTVTEEDMKTAINWFEKSVDAVLGTKF
jgi:4-aminobutyrate aminotransferase